MGDTGVSDTVCFGQVDLAQSRETGEVIQVLVLDLGLAEIYGEQLVRLQRLESAEPDRCAEADIQPRVGRDREPASRQPQPVVRTTGIDLADHAHRLVARELQMPHPTPAEGAAIVHPPAGGWGPKDPVGSSN